MDDFVPTWDDPLGPNAWTRLTWPEMVNLHNCLVTLVALTPCNRVRPVGTGFILNLVEGGAICVTAAHNFYLGIHRIQFPNSGHHHSTLPEFQPNFERVDLTRVFSIFRNGESLTFAPVTGACWDKHRDFCVFEARPHEEDLTGFNPQMISISPEQPKLGQKVAIMGYAGLNDYVVDISSAGTIESRLELRIGTVASITSGVLVPGLVAETTIPVLPGMSGSPGLIWRKFSDPPLVFGFVSSDPESVWKDDFTSTGQSQLSLLEIESVKCLENQRTFKIAIGPVACMLGKLSSTFYPSLDGIVSASANSASR